MKEYELLYIVGTQYTDTEISAIQEKILELLKNAGANVLRNENLGKIRLAYPIKKIRHGSYILVHFDVDAVGLIDLNRRLALRDDILRHTILERAPGALERKCEISSYTPPLSDEAKAEIETRAPARRTRTFVKRVAAPVLAPPTPTKMPELTPMSMEELDQKLDKILEGDITENL